MALSYFCGGCPHDIALAHGVNDEEVLKSVWDVVDAVNLTTSMNIKFPACHDEQRKIAAASKAKTKIGLSNCVGPIDGLLIWTHKPSKKCFEFGKTKFFVVRKRSLD